VNQNASYLARFLSALLTATAFDYCLAMLRANIPAWILYLIEAYVFAFMAVTAGLFLWRTKRRKDRPPEKFKLLRGPGETQRRRAQKADENLFSHMVGGAFLPLVAGWLVLLLAIRLPQQLVLLGAVTAVLIFFASAVVAVIIVFRFMRRRRDDLLGYLGERAVAEQLDSLRTEGWLVFHDVPAKGRHKKFNIDHVAVGPTGVASIEVKTRRKRPGRPGFEEHVVTHDGQRLIWPWGEDRCGIDQVQWQAEWLREFIEQRTALRINPKPILAFPGWYVQERAIGAFRVAQHRP
jgi:membrane protein implicated in regulation of membrane protease activity